MQPKPISPSFVATDHRRIRGNRRLAPTSMAKPEGSSQGEIGQVFFTFRAWGSICAISLLSSMLTYTFPFPSVTGNSGFPSRAMVPAALPEAASMAVTLLLRPLKANMRLLYGSYKMPSGFLPVGTFCKTERDLRSKSPRHRRRRR